MAKALIAMSGGVDSSVSALLTIEKGYECIGCTMRLFDGATDDESAGIEQSAEAAESTCCSLSDVEDARSVAYKLGMKYYVFNFTRDFREQVILPFVNCYLKGQTPNPCIECNKHLKFDRLYQRGRELGYDYIVTGHYARITRDGELYQLRKAMNAAKDQSYVLYGMTQDQLAHTMFPLGELDKERAREIALANGFVNANKKDSQDICFVPDGDYARVVERESGAKAKPGNFVDLSGAVLGQHKGIIHYTIGQRKGLGISSTEPYFVVSIHPEKNEVVLGRNEDLFGTRLTAMDVNWISGIIPEGDIRVSARIRYHAPEKAATLRFTDASHFELVFDEPQRAITPGQAVVVYDDDIVLGGGVIC